MLLIKVAAAPRIELTPKERKIFDFLLEANQRLGLNSTLRVAGGWVRDKLLGKDSDDIDISIDNMKGEDFAAHLGKLEGHPALGRTYSVRENPEQSKHIGSANVKIYGEPIDLVNLREETYPEDSRIPEIVMATGPDAAEKDAKRRDLTINSMFYNLNTDQIEDYVGGLQDLQEMKLKTPDDPIKTLLEDPLRGLRWLRFLSRFEGATLDPSLVQALRDPRFHEQYEKVSPKRASKELRKLMEGKQPGTALKLMYDTGLYKKVFDTPKFRTLSELDMDQQTRHHEHKLMDHTFMVMDHLNKIMISENVDPETRMLMNFAAFMHDFGKAAPASFSDPEGERIQRPHPNRPNEMMYKGHEDASAEVADEILNHIGLGKRARRFVTTIIQNHMLHEWPEPTEGIPTKEMKKQQRKYFKRMHEILSKIKPIEKGNPLMPDELDPDKKSEAIPSRPYDVGELADLAMMHVESDILGTSKGREQEAEMIRRHRKNLVDYYRNHWASMSPLIRGDEIISLFPSLNVGNTIDGRSFVVEIIDKLKQKQATGEISTKEDALKLIEQMRRGIQDKYGSPNA